MRRLTPEIRSVATYDTSLAVLKQIAEAGIPAKTGLMLGLGETQDEVEQTMKDVMDVGCRLLSIGQYLQPSKHNVPVVEYIHPKKFEFYKQFAQSICFIHVESGPLVRSSYRSATYLEKNET